MKNLKSSILSINKNNSLQFTNGRCVVICIQLVIKLFKKAMRETLLNVIFQRPGLSLLQPNCSNNLPSKVQHDLDITAPWFYLHSDIAYIFSFPRMKMSKISQFFSHLYNLYNGIYKIYMATSSVFLTWRREQACSVLYILAFTSSSASLNLGAVREN